MVLTKRIIPCLDVANGRVVKGLNFESIKDAGDPVQLAEKYSNEGADELVFLDITASSEQRETIKSLVKKIAEVIDIPFTVGGGVKSLQHARDILLNGADKVAINTAAIKNPVILKEASRMFGSQCIVLSIEAKRRNNNYWEALTDNGREKTNIGVIDWIVEAEKLGVGEILLTSVDQEGTQTGYDIELTEKVSSKVNIPIIACGGAGSIENIEVLLKNIKPSICISSLFHYKKYTPNSLKRLLNEKGFYVR